MIPSRTFSPKKSSKCQFFDRDGATRTGKTMIGKVGENAQVNTSARDGFDMRSEPFAGGVDCVRAHRVTDIIDEMNDDERSDGGVC